MSNVALSRNSLPMTSTYSNVGLIIGLVVAAWFTLITLLGANEIFVAAGPAPPLALLTATTSPIIVFLVAFSTLDTFREFVLSADLRLIMAVQSWRIGGFSFLALYAYNILPGYLAWPAGVGDIAIGVTAPLILAALIRQPDFAGSKSFIAWNVLGILDLVLAIGMGALGSRLIDTVAGSISTAPMSYLPLVLVPTFFLPAFVILHLAALFQAKARRSSV